MKERYPITKKVNLDEQEVIDIYRHLSGSNKLLIRRTIKNLDEYYSGDPCLQGYFWDYDSPAKVTHYSLAESDFLNSFRALNVNQRSELLETLHMQVLGNSDYYFNVKLSKEDIKLITDYQDLNTAGKKLVKQTVETLRATSAQNEKKNIN
ncbi:MAG: hypothetical protein K2O41_04840 [Clostridia bacterium]|nr:hypothetical protein [Clostridia bacterium]